MILTVLTNRLIKRFHITKGFYKIIDIFNMLSDEGKLKTVYVNFLEAGIKQCVGYLLGEVE